MSSSERIDDLLDADSFVEWNRTVPETDPLEFPGYLGKLEAQREKTGLEEGVRTGVGRIAGLRVAIGIMESQFFMEMCIRDSLVAAGEAQEGLWFARAALQRDRSREDAYICLMQAQLAAGQRTACLLYTSRCV